jgi:hypothetical protein
MIDADRERFFFSKYLFIFYRLREFPESKAREKKEKKYQAKDMFHAFIVS